jgi:hypothetical protein
MSSTFAEDHVTLTSANGLFRMMSHSKLGVTLQNVESMVEKVQYAPICVTLTYSILHTRCVQVYMWLCSDL